MHQASSDTRNPRSSLFSAYELCNSCRAGHTDSANSTQLSPGAEAALKSSSRLEHYGHFEEKLQIYFPFTINSANLSTWLNPALYCRQQRPLLTSLLQLHSVKPVKPALHNCGVNQQGFLTLYPAPCTPLPPWTAGGCLHFTCLQVVCATCH